MLNARRYWTELKVLVIGNGGREYALCKHIRGSSLCTELFCAPGNRSTEKYAKNIPIDLRDKEGLIRWAIANNIDLVIPMCELTIATNITEELLLNHIACFAPNSEAADLELDRLYGKEVANDLDIRLPYYEACTNVADLERILTTTTLPVYIKCNDVAPKETSFLFTSLDQLDKAKSCFSYTNCLIIERYIEGEEFTFQFLADGESVIPLPVARDFKLRNNVNSGGMGAISYPSLCPGYLQQEAFVWAWRTVQNTQFTGLLNLNCIYNKQLYLLEYNCRWGDPETQVALLRIYDDLLPLMYDAANNKFKKHNINISKYASMCLVLEHLHYPINHAFPIDRTVDVANVYSTQANPRHFNLITLEKDIDTCRAEIYATAKKFEQQLYYREDI